MLGTPKQVMELNYPYQFDASDSLPMSNLIHSYQTGVSYDKHQFKSVWHVINLLRYFRAHFGHGKSRRMSLPSQKIFDEAPYPDDALCAHVKDEVEA
jgi:hypothetical protein